MSTRAAAWLAWSLWTLALMSFAVSGLFRSLNSSTPTIEPRTPLFLDFWYLLLFMSFATVGALVASRQPGNAIGWIFCWLGLSFSLGGVGEEYALYALVTEPGTLPDRKSTRLNSSHANISYAVFCLKNKGEDDLGVHVEVSIMT